MYTEFTCNYYSPLRKCNSEKKNYPGKNQIPQKEILGNKVRSKVFMLWLRNIPKLCGLKLSVNIFKNFFLKR